MSTRTPEEAVKAACDLLGSQRALAALLGVAPPTVNEWVLGKSPVPPAQAPHIERLTGGAVRCEETCPKVPWDIVRGTSVSPLTDDELRMRDEFAGQAMSGLLAAFRRWPHSDGSDATRVAGIAYQQADAMVKARRA